MKMRSRQIIQGVLLLIVSAGFVYAETIAHWNFNDREAGTVLAAGDRIADSSGRGNDLYVNLGASYGKYDYASPDYGDEGAVRLAVGNGHLYFQPGHEFSDGGPAAGTDSIGDIRPISFTYEVIFRCPYNTTTTAVYALLSKIPGGSNDPQFWWRIETAGGKKLNFYMRDAGKSAGVSYTYTGTTGLYDGQWHHVAVVRDYGQSTLRLYIDYVEVGANTNTGYFNEVVLDGPFAVGNFAQVTNRDFVGNIDQVRITHDVLSPDEFLPKASSSHAVNPMPADKAYDVPSGSVVLHWDTVYSADPNSGDPNNSVDPNDFISQSVIVASDRTMENIIASFNDVAGMSVTLNNVERARQYYWRVDTTDSFGETPILRKGSVWSFQAEEAEGNIAGYWAFDDSLPGTSIDEGGMILDSSGNNRHLYTLYEAMENPQVPNYGNPSASYGTSASYEAYTDSQLKLLPGYDFGEGTIAGGGINLPSDESLTIEAVFKVPYGSNSVGAIFSYLPDHPEETYWFTSNLPQIWLRVQDTGLLRFWIQDNLMVSSSVDSAVLVNDGQWHHVAAVRDKSSNQLKIYVDYVNVTTKADTTTADIVPTGYMVVGGFHGYSSRNTNGSIDFVKVTRSALEPAQFVQPIGLLPTNPSPVNGATGVPLSYTLSWLPIADAAVTGQQVVMAADPYMQNVVKTIAAIGNTAATGVMEPGMTYYWRVDSTGTDSGGAFTDRKGDIWSFKTPICLLTYEDGDINGDCIVDILDLYVLSANWLRSEYEE